MKNLAVYLSLLYGASLFLFACSREMYKEYKYAHAQLIKVECQSKWDDSSQENIDRWIGFFDYRGTIMHIDIPDTVRFKIGLFYLITPQK